MNRPADPTIDSPPASAGPVPAPPAARAQAAAASSLPAGTSLDPNRLPASVRRVPWFGLFNALSWQITLGPPIILYAKSLGASSTILGLITALTPLLVICQLPAARWMETHGYKRLILTGWGARTIIIFLLATIPLVPGLSPGWRLAGVVLLLAIFNFFRGIAAGAWLPWYSELVPDHQRGLFLATEQRFAQTGALLSMIGSAMLLAGTPGAWQFAVVFLISALAGVVGWLLIKGVPDAMQHERRKQSAHRVPWGHMLAWPPFARLIRVNLMWVTAVGALGVFAVSFLRGTLGYRESQVLAAAAVSVAAALLITTRIGPLVDRVGSRPVLAACMLGLSAAAAGWWAIATGLLAGSAWLVLSLHALAGASGVGFYIGNSRLTMATIPLMGRNHFFALFTVITSLGLAASPLAWGVILDLIGTREFAVLGITWNRYAVLFAACAVVAAAGAGMVGLLSESAKGK